LIVVEQVGQVAEDFDVLVGLRGDADNELHPLARKPFHAIRQLNDGDAGRSPKDKGSIVHDGKLETTSGTIGTIRARNRWVSPDGELICTDDTTIRVRGGSGDIRMIDYEVTLLTVRTADQGTGLHFCEPIGHRRVEAWARGPAAAPSSAYRAAAVPIVVVSSS